MQRQSIPAAIDLVWEEAEKRLEAQFRQADALDTKAGVLIGVHALAGGLIASIAGQLERQGRWIGIGVVAALLVSMWLSLLAFRAQDYDRSPSPEVLWRFADWEPGSVRFRLISTRFQALEQNRRKLRSKALLVWTSAAMLGVLASIVAIATVVSLIR